MTRIRYWGYLLGLGLLTSALLSGCSLRKFFAGKLDWVLMYQIDSYFDLESEQEKVLKPQIKNAVAYLRKEKSEFLLSAIRELIRQADQKKIEDNAVEVFVTRIDAVRKDLEASLLGPLLTMSLSLDDDQIKHFEKKLKKSNENIEDLHEEDAEDFPDAAAKELKRRFKILENIYGKLRDDQKKDLESILTPTREIVKDQLQSRKNLHAFLASTLRARKKDALEKSLKDWFATGELFQDPAYLAYRKAAAKRWQDAFRTLHRTLNDEQWKTLKERLKEVEDDILQFQKN